MKKIIFVLFLLVFSSGLKAQAPTYIWTQSDTGILSTDAQSWTYTVYVNNGVGTVLTGVTCSGTAPSIVCQAVVPSGTPLVVNTKYELTSKTATSGESVRSIPFIRAPVAPTNFRTQ